MMYKWSGTIMINPSPQYQASQRKFQGIASIVWTPSGRLYAVWYGGKTPGEDKNNYVSAAFSDDRGDSWSQEILAIDPDGEGPLRAFDPEVWLSPDGKLWLFWTVDTRDFRSSTPEAGVNGGLWAITTTNPEARKPTWSDPIRICDGVMMCKPTVLSSGEWCLPVSTWRPEKSAQMVVSTDKGRTWTIRGGAQVPEEVRVCDEHMIVEKEDGRLWMLIRTRAGISESTSCDGGKTWTSATPSGIAHVAEIGSRFFIQRLKSGNLLLVKHGDIHEQTGRTKLTALLSQDDGTSWPYKLLLDDREKVAYPDGDQADDGTIYLIYDFNRQSDREILMARFGEADIEAGSFMQKDSKPRLVVNKATG